MAKRAPLVRSETSPEPPLKIATNCMHRGYPYSLHGLFVSKSAYQQVASEFRPFHRHDLNVFLHFWTTGIGLWGAVQLAVVLGQSYVVYTYMCLAALTCPSLTGILHTVVLYGMIVTPVPVVGDLGAIHVCGLAIVLGYGLQDLAHWICMEKTFMNDYIRRRPWMLLIHTFWLMPLVIDSVLMRKCYLPNLVNRNRIVSCSVASRKAVDDLRIWVNTHVRETNETTHLWPHEQTETSCAVRALEDDSAILKAFRTVFDANHFDVLTVQGMNEIYVTAVGAKKEINSDAVFYTKHEDGPYWFLPWASLYRVLVGVTPNVMVRTRFKFQHESQDKVVDMYDVLGFDYNRELHWIDHVSGITNTERRSLIKLHFIIYPKGWHQYGRFCANLNTRYNTWARKQFLRTLVPTTLSDWGLAWQIWIATTVNATLEKHIGWANMVYIGIAYALGPLPFLILTSFRHYLVYIATFAYPQPMVAHGSFMRDALLYKTIAMLHLSSRLLPMVQLPGDVVGCLLVSACLSITMLATARLGIVRTYFGTELGFATPQRISAFPYGVIPHPMITGQIFGYMCILFWWRDRIALENITLVAGHIACYTIHMIQEILTSSY